MANKFYSDNLRDRGKSPGLMAREREVADLQEAANAGSYQARTRLRPAMSGLERQRNIAEGRPALAKRKK